MYVRLYSLKHDPYNWLRRLSKSRPLLSLYRPRTGKGESPLFHYGNFICTWIVCLVVDCRGGDLSARTRRGRDLMRRVSSSRVVGDTMNKWNCDHSMIANSRQRCGKVVCCDNPLLTVDFGD
jgi:hypothetical protein